MMKHEKAILVGLGYLNGFIVAFIAFALPSYLSVPEVASQRNCMVGLCRDLAFMLTFL